MHSLAKFPTRAGRIGKPLPDPLVTFGTNRVHFRRGATSMVAGQPGTFKSVLALNFLVTWAREGCGSLYFSADSDESTVFKRCAGIITGDDASVIDRAMLHGQYARYADALGELLGTVRFEYRTLPMEDIAYRAASYEQAYGTYPDAIFVDNLINYAESSTDWGSMIDLLKELDSLARETQSHICVLHHASEGFPRGTPLPSAAIQGKVTQIPRLVLTTAANGTAVMVACVKNTHGPAFPTASRHMNLNVEPSLQITDLDEQEMVNAA